MNRHALLAVITFTSLTAASAEELSVGEVVRRSRDSVVVITTEDRDGKAAGLGTGFVISDDGLIATNLHVIGEARPIWVQPRGGERIPVTEVFASDPNFDLALIRVAQQDLPPLQLALREDVLQDGQTVMAIGHPLGLENSVVSGVVSGQRDIEGMSMWQAAMTIEPGNSGGPLLDLQGKVHGVITMKSVGRQPFGFAVKVNQLRKLIDNPNPIRMEQWKTIGQIDFTRWSPRMGARWRQRSARTLVEGAGGGFGGRALLLRKEPPLEVPFELAVSVKLNDESGAAGLAFHSDDGEKHYGFYPSAGKLRLTSFEGPTVFQWNVIREVQTEHYQPGSWNEIKVRVEEDRIVGYVNGNEVVAVNDVRQPPGRIGLCKFRDTIAEFKQFRFGATVDSNSISQQKAKELADALKSLGPRSELADRDLQMQTTQILQRMAVLEQQARDLESQAGQTRALAQDLHTAFVSERLRQASSAEQDADIDLLRAALLIAKIDNPELDVDAYVEQVDGMALTIRESVKADGSEAERIRALDDYLFNQRGFHGSRTDYYNAANSHLDRVIDDREGLPITLSVLYMALARRLDLNVVGLGLPGHFVVRHEPEVGDAEIIDVFDRGRRLGDEKVNMLLLQLGGERTELERFPAASHRSILVRMLSNLLNVAEGRDDAAAMLRYLEGIVAVDSDNASMRGLRGVLRHRQGRKRAALEDIDWILENKPTGVDLQQVQAMREMLAR
jgi:regulator of sirC expression with transglutaminase-like and TPR domain